MRCPFCFDMDSRVVDSRLVSRGNQIRRRRECNACNERFTTYESVELNLPRILKSDGRRELFCEDKLRNGILLAIEKRPVETDDVEAMIAAIKHRLRSEGGREVESGKIGDWVSVGLLDIDQVAYVRFASVYRDFKDIDAFIEEVERVRNTLPPNIKRSQLKLPGSDEQER